MVHDDATSDTLTGNPAALDWFFAALVGTNLDTLKEKTLDEIITEL